MPVLQQIRDNLSCVIVIFGKYSIVQLNYYLKNIEIIISLQISLRKEKLTVKRISDTSMSVAFFFYMYMNVQFFLKGYQ